MQEKEYILSKQLARSGTSIGANIAEAQQAQSKADFISKMSIALKESYETDYLDQNAFTSMIADCRELERLLISIIKSAKE